jgi:peptidoglycan/xylan/chitin deacetylase (PgdA/CDA1 family)
MEELQKVAKAVNVDREDQQGDGFHDVRVTFDDGFQSFLENALPELIQRKIPVAVFIPTGYIGKEAEWIEDLTHEDRLERVMTEEQIKELPSELVIIGSHSVTHTNLKLLREEDLRRELIESKKELESITGRNVTLISLPYGEYDERVVEVARQMGYRRIFSSLSRLARRREYVVERVGVKPSDWPLEFRMKILGAYRWLPFTIGLKRRLRSMMRKDSNRPKVNFLIGSEAGQKVDHPRISQNEYSSPQ